MFINTFKMIKWKFDYDIITYYTAKLQLEIWELMLFKFLLFIFAKYFFHYFKSEAINLYK